MKTKHRLGILVALLLLIAACGGCKRLLRGAVEDGFAEFITSSTADAISGLLASEADRNG